MLSTASKEEREVLHVCVPVHVYGSFCIDGLLFGLCLKRLLFYDCGAAGGWKTVATALGIDVERVRDVSYHLKRLYLEADAT